MDGWTGQVSVVGNKKEVVGCVCRNNNKQAILQQCLELEFSRGGKASRRPISARKPSIAGHAPTLRGDNHPHCIHFIC